MQRRALGEHQRGAGVPQLVRVPVAKPGPVAQPGVGTGEVLGIERCPGLAGEDQSVVPPEGTGRDLVLRLTCVVLAQLGQDLRGQRQRAPGPGCLQFADDELGLVSRLLLPVLDPLDAVTDLDGPGGPVKAARCARRPHAAAHCFTNSAHSART